MRLLQSLLLSLHASVGLSLVLPSDTQAPLPDSFSLLSSHEFSGFHRRKDTASAKRIAVIGTGITGATAAYNIAEDGRLQSGGSPQITLFERNAIIGGRITTTQVYGDPSLTIDTCAATFASITDFCLTMTAMSVGLSTLPFTRSSAGLGIWNGEKFEGLIEDDGFRDPQTWTLARKLRWFQRYGAAPWDYATRVTSETSSFMLLARNKFSSLADEVKDKKLEKVVREGVCGNEFLNCTDQKERLFLREVVAAGIRERFFGDYDQLNGQDALLALTNENVVSVDGGNLRLIDRLIKLSGATVKISTTVEKLTRTTHGWELDYSQGIEKGTESFDAVIVAAPFSLTNIIFDPPLATEVVPSLNLSYADTFVTHFATPNRLNASFFNVKEPGPQNILTTDTGETASPPFFSLTLVDGNIVNPENGRQENLYKLVSEALVPDAELAEYIEQNETLTEPTVTWLNRQPLPQSVPRLARNQTILDQIEIAPDLFYAGGGEQITSTVEFGCRMGRNAARLAFPTSEKQ